MKFVFANWKMNLLHKQARELACVLAKREISNNFQVAIFPPFTNLDVVSQELLNSKIALGGQDCSAYNSGAYTGEISAEMLFDAGCKYVLLGHSERKQYHNESNELVKQKSELAIENGIIPVICVGENLAQREAENYLKIITEQVQKSIPQNGDFIIAYEPVWAIGTGKTPNLEEINEVHQAIKSIVYKPILYGGSVKSSNAKEIMANDVVDGVLVGGASLNVDEFAAMFSNN